jgi:hypothetical protein
MGEKNYTVWVMNGCMWSNGGIILTGEKLNPGRKTLYFVGDGWMSVEQWWNDTNRGKLKYWEKSLYSVCDRRMDACGEIVE